LGRRRASLPGTLLFLDRPLAVDLKPLEGVQQNPSAPHEPFEAPVIEGFGRHVIVALKHLAMPEHQADLKRKKQIAKMRAHENVAFVKSVVEEHMKLDIQATWDALEEMRHERNLIAHGVWSVRFGGDTPGETAESPIGLPMPDKLKLAIADAVTIFSHIDCMVIESIWVLEQVEGPRHPGDCDARRYGWFQG
jgi:hypothetical protein